MGSEVFRCNVCGAAIEKGTKTCPYCGCAVSGDSKGVTVYSASDDAAETVSFDEGKELVTEKKIGLKWANFLGYFVLWISFLSCVSSAYSVFSGKIYEIYGVSAKLVYAGYGNGLKYADMFYGASLLFIALISVLAAISIIKRKATAGPLVAANYLLSAILCVAYYVLVYLTTGIYLVTSYDCVSLAISVLFFFINLSYFKKRSHIFVN